MKRTDTYYRNRAARIIKQIGYATLATVSASGDPWNSPVQITYDKALNLYWSSDKESQHSRNVHQNGKVFIVMYDSTYSPAVPGGERNGVYLEAQAYELHDAEEIRSVCRLKKGTDNDDTKSFMGSAVRRVYKAVPERAWINDVEVKNGEFIRDYRVELPLSGIRKALSRLSKSDKMPT